MFKSNQQTYLTKIAKKYRLFFAKRSPRSDTVDLTLRNVYIFFSRSGVLFGLLLIITFITGINYGNNLVLGLCFYLASIWVISLHLTFSHVYGLKFKLISSPIVSVGEVAWVNLELNNDKSQPSRQLQLTFDHKLHQEFADNTRHTGVIEDSKITSTPKTKSLALANKSNIESFWQQHNISPTVYLTRIKGRASIQLPLIAYQRGRLDLPRLIVSTVYPLGIMRAWSYVYFATPIWVYPKPIAFDMQSNKVISSNDEHEFSAHSIVGQNDFESLDEYQVGESLARVSWAHVARGQGMMTKRFADNVGREQLLDYQNMPASLHEHKLSQLSYAVLKLGEAGSTFQLNLPNDEGVVGQGSAFVETCLLRLAKCP